jgi:hypothetical protein
MGSHPASEISI